MKARNNINTLFGTTFNVSEMGAISWTPNSLPLNSSVQDYIMRHLNLYKKIKKTDRALDALSGARTYMAAKNKRVVEEVGRLSNVYMREYRTALERGYSQERANKLATEEVDYQKKRSLADIDEDFPTEINDKILPSTKIRLSGK